MSETAEAIARMRAEAKAAQAAANNQAVPESSVQENIHAGSTSGRKMSKAVSWGVLTKRQKTS